MPIQSDGNNVWGDAEGDTHQLSGSLLVSGSILIGGGVSRRDTAFSAIYDYNDTTFENQLSAHQGGGFIVRAGSGTITGGQLHYLHTNGAWVVADADAVSTGGSQLLGISMGTSPATDGMLLQGFFRVTASFVQGTAVVGAPVYVSEVSGAFDFTAPSATGDFVRIIGHCVDTHADGAHADVLLYFDPDKTWVEVA